MTATKVKPTVVKHVLNNQTLSIYDIKVRAKSFTLFRRTWKNSILRIKSKWALLCRLSTLARSATNLQATAQPISQKMQVTLTRNCLWRRRRVWWVFRTCCRRYMASKMWTPTYTRRHLKASLRSRLESTTPHIIQMASTTRLSPSLRKSTTSPLLVKWIWKSSISLPQKISDA